MQPHVDIVRSLLHAYRDSWQRQAGAQWTAWELQQQLRLALTLYDVLSAAAEQRGAEVNKRGGTERDSFIRDTHEVTTAWYEPSRQVMGVLKERSRDGAVFEGLMRLERLCHDVGWYLAGDPERMIRALRDVDEGRMIPLQELRDELRRRSGAAVR